MSAGNPCAYCYNCGVPWGHRDGRREWLAVSSFTLELTCWGCGRSAELRNLSGPVFDRIRACTNPAKVKTVTTENKTPANWQEGLRMADRIAHIVTNTLIASSVLPNDKERVLLLSAAIEEIGRLAGVVKKENG